MGGAALGVRRRGGSPPSVPGPAAASPPPGGLLRRLRSYRVPAALALAHVVLALLVFDPTPHTGGDSAGYIALARSLLERHAYVTPYDPALPPEGKYPPGFPAILAVAMLVGIRSWAGLKLVIVAFSGAAVALSYLWLRRWRSPELAFGVGAVLAMSPGVLGLGHWVLSDVPFWALTMAALWGFEAPPDGPPGGRTARIRLAAAATVLAYFTRSAGLPLLLAAGGWLALRRRWRDLALLGAAALPLAVLWALRGEAAGAAAYISEFWLVDPYRPELGRAGLLALLERPVENAVRYATMHLPVLLFGRAHALLLPIGLALIALAAAGWALRVRRPGVAELFLPLYLGLILVWPAVWSGERFLLPALPALLAYAGYALVRGAAWVGPRVARPAAIVAVAVTVLAAAPGLSAAVRDGVACTAAYLEGDRYPCLPAPPWRDYFELAEWTADALPEGAVVVSRKPRIFFVLSGHRGLVYPLSQEPEEFFAAVRETGARYLVFDQVSQLSVYYLTPVLLARPEAFCVVRSLGPGRAALLGIRPMAGPRAGAGAAGARDDRLVLAMCPDDYRRLPPSR